MTPFRTRILLALSVLLVVAVAVAWAFWPTKEDRADLRTVAPIITTTTTTTTTTSTTVPTTTGPKAVAPPPSTTTTTAPPAAVNPNRLRIPALGVDAAVVPVGLEANGDMEIPGAADVGWYELGPRPGAPGSAVLAAHIDYNGQRGAFFDLGSVPVGAEILVDGDGGEQRFVVSEREQVAKADVDLSRYFTNDGPNRITLITCGGGFDKSIRHYEDNLIITAVRP